MRITTRYIALFAALVLLGMQSLWAQERAASLHYLALPATSKAMALGGVTTSAIANDAALALESPALFGWEHDHQLSLSYLNYFGSQNVGTAFYTRSIGRRHSWGVGARFVDYGVQQERALSGELLGTFRPKDIMLQGSYSHELTDHLRVGLSIKGIYSTLHQYTAWGIGADLGLNYYSENKERSVGLALVNVGSLLKPYGEGRQLPLPWDIRLGYSQRFEHAPFQVHLTAYALRPKHVGEFTPELSRSARILRHLAIGVEYVPSNKFWLGVGYNPRIAQDYKALRGSKFSGLSAGVGFNQAKYRVALSAVAYDSSFWALMATFSTDFGFASRL